MAKKILFSFTSTYRVENGQAITFEVVHEDTPPYAVEVRKAGATTYESAGGFESHAYIGQMFNSTRYDGQALVYKGQGEFTYAALQVPALTLTAAKTDATTANGTEGSVTLTASGGAPGYQYSKEGDLAWYSNNVFSGLAAGLYTFQVKDAMGTVKEVQVQILQPDGVLLSVECNGYHLQQQVSNSTGGWRWGVVVEYNVESCGYTVVYGCTNPEATNYDPNATVDNGSCIIPEKVSMDALPALAVAGNPLTVVLHSAPTGQAGSKASATLTIGSPSGTTSVTIDGQAFRYATSPQAGEFNNAPTLAAALLDNLVIDSRYTVSSPGTMEVLLTARKEGSAYAPVITLSDNGLVLTETPGTDALRSQTKDAWGCYVEVWGCEGYYGASVDKGTGTFLERMEKPYAPGNAYAFDIASTLRLLLSHELLSESARMAPYFVRYGEVYRADGETGRRRHAAGESAVLWALDGVLPLTSLNELNAPLLLNKLTGTNHLPLHGGTYAEALYVLGAGGLAWQVSAVFRYFDGTTLTETLVSVTPASGGVQKLALQPVFARAYELNESKTVLNVALTLTATLGAAVSTIATLKYKFGIKPDARCVVFLSSLSAYETLWLEGYDEPQLKRSVQTYGKGIPAGATSSSRAVGVWQAEVQQSIKGHTGLLTRPQLDSLAQELGGSPEVYLYSNGSYTAYTLTDMEAKADVLEEEYTLGLTFEPGLPHNPLTN